MAVSAFRNFIKWFFITLNLIIGFIFLLACLSPVLNPAQWPLMGLLSLAVPYLVLLLFFSIIFWLITKPVRAFIPIIILLIGWKQLADIWAWHPSRTPNLENKSDTVLRIISWNVRGLYGLSTNGYKQNRNRNEIAALVNNLKADIVCLQEFNNSTYDWDKNRNNVSLFAAQTPYYFFARDFKNRNGLYFGGSILFSRYPIIDSGKIKFPGATAESLIYIDIVKGADTLRIFTTHLQSFLFTPSDYADLEKIKERDDEAVEASENIYSKMKIAYISRSNQANMVRSEMDKSPYPSVICGDFNDVPNSYTYFHIRGKRQDAFLVSSFGIGRTYSALAPSLRIDFILPDRQFNIHQFDMVDEGLSDHHLLVADISTKK